MKVCKLEGYFSLSTASLPLSAVSLWPKYSVFIYLWCFQLTSCCFNHCGIPFWLLFFFFSAVLLIGQRCSSKPFQSFLISCYIITMKQVICGKSKANMTHRNGRIDRLQSNSVGLSFVIFGECVSSSEGSALQSHLNASITGDFTPCTWSVDPQI